MSDEERRRYGATAMQEVSLHKLLDVIAELE
jgi:hypothetical protein